MLVLATFFCSVTETRKESFTLAYGFRNSGHRGVGVGGMVLGAESFGPWQRELIAAACSRNSGPGGRRLPQKQG